MPNFFIKKNLNLIYCTYSYSNYSACLKKVGYNLKTLTDVLTVYSHAFAGLIPCL